MRTRELEEVEKALEPDSPDSRTGDSLEASVLTSADTKIAYNKDQDRYEAIIVGDINAFPEGLMKHSNLQEEDITGQVAEALAGEVDGDVVVNLPEYAFNGEDGLVDAEKIPDPQDDSFSEQIRELGLSEEWLIEEKLKLAKGAAYSDPELSGIPDIAGVQNVHLTYGGRDIGADEDGMITYNGRTVDRCINLSDRGEKLADRIQDAEALSNIVNAPTAVWNSDIEATQKPALMDKANSVVEDFDRTQAVDAETVESREEIYERVQEGFENGESLVLKTDPMGSWGDSIVVFDYEEFQTAVQRQFVKGEYAGSELLDGEEADNIQDYVDVMIESESARVSEKSNRDDVELIGEEGFYSRGDTEYAVMEQAAAGTTKIEGETYHIVESEMGPIDFVPLVVSNGEPDTASYIARVSDNDGNLNVNRGSDKFDVQSLENFYDENQDLFEDTAGREVALSELEQALDDAGQVAYLSRNLTAYDAERSLS